MNIKLLSLLLLFAAFGFLIAGNTLLDSFKASSDGKAIKLEWRSSDESGISRFDIERAGTDMNFRFVKSIDAKGYPTSYIFTDDEAFFKGEGDQNNVQLKTTYYYRLKIVRSDNTFSYSDNANVQHNPSGLRRTWGMIKEMFK